MIKTRGKKETTYDSVYPLLNVNIKPMISKEKKNWNKNWLNDEIWGIEKERSIEMIAKWTSESKRHLFAEWYEKDWNEIKNMMIRGSSKGKLLFNKFIESKSISK